jgi:hypothetical protein
MLYKLKALERKRIRSAGVLQGLTRAFVLVAKADGMTISGIKNCQLMISDEMRKEVENAKQLAALAKKEIE